MRSTPEWTAFPARFLKDEGVCSLSDILVTGNVPPRYFLSPTACLGILRRAEKRNKALPKALKDVLEIQAVSGSTQEGGAME